MITNTDHRRFGLGRIILDATAEATRRGDRTVGTDHLVLALLADPATSPARALGVSIADARDALETLDDIALSALGITATGSGPLNIPGKPRRRLRLTPAAAKVFVGSRRLSAGERLGPRHVLLSLLLTTRPDPAADLLDALGVDRNDVRYRLGRP
ncbi:MAG: Clp protease N-terminal domain-containing protein [Nakamurella sp.]